MRPTRDEVLMDIARTMAQRGTCSRARVGVVIAREGRILVTGYNGAPAGMKHCKHELGEKFEGDTDAGCKRSVHAEANAIAYAARYGIEVKGADLFTTLCPCLACAQLIINSGLERVIYGREYRDKMGLQLLTDQGMELKFA